MPVLPLNELATRPAERDYTRVAQCGLIVVVVASLLLVFYYK